MTMNVSPPPDWNAEGFLPPVDSSDPISRNRSPYPIGLVDLIERFGTSPERCEILKGFLEYRSFLHGLGISEGFQWIDGSFTEDKESRSGAAPNDIDVVTYFKQPPGLTQNSLSPEERDWLFKPKHAKSRFKVDGIIMPLGNPSDERNISEICYWHGLFSHTRQSDWKGYLQITLSLIDDADAAEHLNQAKQRA
jgi:hypothetical protein